MALNRHDTDLLPSQGRFRIGKMRSLLGLLNSPMAVGEFQPHFLGPWGQLSLQPRSAGTYGRSSLVVWARRERARHLKA